MQSGNWLTSGPLNTIFYKTKLPDGTVKEGQLRFTKYQADCFKEFHSESNKDRSHYALGEIVLNPDPEKREFTRDEIEAAFDIDQMQLLNKIWLDRKVADPRLSPVHDPKLTA